MNRILKAQKQKKNSREGAKNAGINPQQDHEGNKEVGLASEAALQPAFTFHF
jgi:hypothetical protein